MSDDTHLPSAKKVSEKNRRHYKYRSTKCLNCSQPLDLTDVYCPYCSQLNSTKQLSLKDFFNEFLNSIVSYDSRLRYTVSELLFRPGRVTTNYSNGQRLKYANPFRFFLSVSIIYFLLNSLVTTLGSEDVPIYTISDPRTPVAFSWDTYTKDAEKLEDATIDSTAPQNLERAKERIANTPGLEEVDSLLTAEIDKHIKTDSIVKKVPAYYTEKQLDTMSWTNNISERLSLYKEFYEKSDINNPAEALDSLRHDNTRYHRWLYSRSIAVDKVSKDPTAYILFMLEKAPFFIFFFTPFFALFFLIIYAKSQFSYMEHMVFIFHLFSFLFIALLFLSLPDALFDTEFFKGILFTIIGPIYFYKALRNFYKQSRFVTIIKFVFLNFVFWMSASFAAGIFFVITAAVY